MLFDGSHEQLWRSNYVKQTVKIVIFFVIIHLLLYPNFFYRSHQIFCLNCFEYSEEHFSQKLGKLEQNFVGTVNLKIVKQTVKIAFFCDNSFALMPHFFIGATKSLLPIVTTIVKKISAKN